MFGKNLYNSKLLELFVYGVVGVSVTALDIGLYALLAHRLYIPYLLANILSFVLANIYAFFANKLLVFHSRSFERRVVIGEAIGFFSARGASCLINVGLMYIGVSLLKLPDLLTKGTVSFIIIILNYILSKFLIFKQETTTE